MVDNIDHNIINELKVNSRISFVAIGKKIHLSPSSVRERVQKLEETGVIKGYSLAIDNTKLGFGLEVFVLLKLFSGQLKQFISEVPSFPEIKKAHRITGTQNIHMKVVLKDQLHLQHFIDRLINFGEPTTHLILSEITSPFLSDHELH